ncbi:MAG: N-acetylmuramoyl-L-alanine amidase [Marmoricola sp.]
MISRTRLLARLGVAVVAVVVTVTLTTVPQAVAVTSHRTLNDTRAVGSAPVAVDFAIEYFGVVADLATPSTHLEPSGEAPYGAARFRVRGHWTAWQPLDQDGAQTAGHFTSALVSVDRADAYQVRGLPHAVRWRAAAINSTDGPSVVVGTRRSDAAGAAGSSCMSRADWGADESLSGWSKGDTQTYYPVQTLVVHHTAGSNSPTQDYAATVRAIYSFHVQSNGWSDIGYQYLIDGTGKVYEGRSAGHVSRSCTNAGGTGSDFGHQSGTDHVVTGAHVAGWNSGNLGIALMGCYDPTSACSGTTTPPTAAKESLTSLLAALSTRHHLDPTGRVHYVNPVNGTTKDVATISGHRDWEATACPGGTLYAALPSIRAAAASQMAGTTTPPPTPTPTPAPAPSPAKITSASCSGARCTFGATGTGTLSWTFGNGAAATGSPVSVTYAKAGSWTVAVTASQTPSTRATRAVSCTVVKRALRCTT